MFVKRVLLNLSWKKLRSADAILDLRVSVLFNTVSGCTWLLKIPRRKLSDYIVCAGFQ